MRLNKSANQVIKHDPLTKAAIVVECAFGREKPLQHQAINQRAHHDAGLFDMTDLEYSGLDTGFYNLSIVAAASVVKLGVQIVKAVITGADADEIGIGKEELTALLRIGEDISDQGFNFFDRVFDLRDRFAVSDVNLFYHPFERPQEKIFLCREIIERRTLAYPGAFCDVLKCDGRISFLSDFIICRLDQFFAPLILIFLYELFSCHFFNCRRHFIKYF